MIRHDPESLALCEAASAQIEILKSDIAKSENQLESMKLQEDALIREMKYKHDLVEHLNNYIRRTQTRLRREESYQPPKEFKVRE